MIEHWVGFEPTKREKPFKVQVVISVERIRQPYKMFECDYCSRSGLTAGYQVEAIPDGQRGSGLSVRIAAKTYSAK